jgi:hypothetical protein
MGAPELRPRQPSHSSPEAGQHKPQALLYRRYHRITENSHWGVPPLKDNDSKERNLSSQRHSKPTPPKAVHKISPLLLKWWTVSGAVIVATTFIAREAFLEPFKEDVETMQHEVEQYTPKGEAFSWRKEIIESREKCDALLSHPDKLSLSNFSDLYRCMSVPSDIYAQELVFDRGTSTIQDLMEHSATPQKPPSEKHEDDRESAIRTDQKAWDLSYPKVQGEQMALFTFFSLAGQTSARLTVHNVKEESGKLKRDAEVLRILVNTLAADVETRREATLQTATDHKVLAERYYKRSRWLVYSLFAVGSILNITGSLWGLKGEADSG